LFHKGRLHENRWDDKRLRLKMERNSLSIDIGSIKKRKPQLIVDNGIDPIGPRVPPPYPPVKGSMEFQ